MGRSRAPRRAAAAVARGTVLRLRASHYACVHTEASPHPRRRCPFVTCARLSSRGLWWPYKCLKKNYQVGLFDCLESGFEQLYGSWSLETGDCASLIYVKILAGREFEAALSWPPRILSSSYHRPSCASPSALPEVTLSIGGWRWLSS